MPQLNKGGKFVFGRSRSGTGGSLLFPAQAAEEYAITAEDQVYLFAGSRSTGGFCVTRKGLPAPSRLGHILTENPALQNDTLPAGAFVRCKGRAYCRAAVTADGRLQLTADMLQFYSCSPACSCLPSAAATSPLPWAPGGRWRSGRTTMPEISRCFEKTEQPAASRSGRYAVRCKTVSACCRLPAVFPAIKAFLRQGFPAAGRVFGSVFGCKAF